MDDTPDRTQLPDLTAVLDAYLELAGEHVTIGADELERLVMARFGLDHDDPAVDELIAGTERALEHPDSPLTMIAPDVVVHVPRLTDGITLTHRLSAAEHAEGYLVLDTDLAGFLRHPDPRTAGEPLHVDDLDGGPISWGGPPGWLAPFPVDALLAVRSAGGEVTISMLDVAPVAPPRVVTTLREVYDAGVEEPWLPLSAEDLAVGLLHRDREAFATPLPPLTELAVAAGLEQRGHEFAHEESVWQSAAEADLQYRLMDYLGPGEESLTALEAIRLLDGGADDPAALRAALTLLDNPPVRIAVTAELLGLDDDPDRLAALVTVADRLVAAAGRSGAAAAGWIAAVAAERDGRVLDAESFIRAAERIDEGCGLVQDRLGWYASDRGAAPEAMAHWLMIELPLDEPDVAVVRPHLAAGVAPEPGRNEPCWCGSGRKYKQCHLGKPARLPLPERVEWLHRKAVTYLERRGGAAELALAEYEDAAGPETPDELVVDTVLHEGAWFERFLVDRGPLLPDDEAQLAATWPAVARTVYEVVDSSTVKDLRDGSQLSITTLGDHAVGDLICGRALPDGKGHRLLGAVFDVERGREHELLAVLARRHGPALLEWLGTSAG